MSRFFGVNVVGREGRCSLNTLNVGGSPLPARGRGDWNLVLDFTLDYYNYEHFHNAKAQEQVEI